MHFYWLPHLDETPKKSQAVFYLTHQQWCNILSGERFKKATRNMPNTPFDLDEFWRFDRALFPNNNIEVPLLCHIGVLMLLSPRHFCDSNPFAFDIKHLLCYDIALTHMKYQFEQSDDILMQRKNLDGNVMECHRSCHSQLFRHSLALPNRQPAWESNDLVVKAAWFEEFRTFICDWPQVCTDKPHCYTCLKGLPEPTFS